MKFSFPLFLLFILCSCTTSTRTPDSTPILQKLDDFSDLWTQDSAGNHCELYVTKNHSLIAKAYNNHRNNAIIRKEVNWNLSEIDSLYLSISLLETLPANDKTKISIAFRDEQRVEYELKPITLKSGANKNLRFDLDNLKDPTLIEKWKKLRHSITRFLILINLDESTSHTKVRIDNVSCAADVIVNPTNTVKLTDIKQSTKKAKLFETISWDMNLYIDNSSSKESKHLINFIPKTTNLQAEIITPSGNKKTTRGYAYKIDEKNNSYKYKLKITPNESGIWKVRFFSKLNRKNIFRHPKEYFFECTDEKYASPISTNKHGYFEDSNNNFFYPLGQNISWAGDYEPWFKEIHENGGNWARIWICSWNNPLDTNYKLNHLNLKNAKNIDRIFELASKYKIQVQLCLNYHAMLGWDWHKSPFNIKNGGTCTNPQDFWIDWKAKEQYKKLLDYIVARWGNSPQLFAWELWNECNLAKHWEKYHITNWHNDIISYLKEIDMHNNMITTSTHNITHMKELWDNPYIDFVPAHRYDPNINRASNTIRETLEKGNRPFFLAEAGSQWKENKAQEDQNGIYLRQALWQTWCHNHRGGPMVWWWDILTTPKNHLRYMKTFSKAINNYDLRDKVWKIIDIAKENGIIASFKISNNMIYGYIYDKKQIYSPQTKNATEIISNEKITIDGINQGEWELQFIDPSGEKQYTKQTIKSNGKLTISPPKIKEDIAIIIKRKNIKQIKIEMK